jgi:hypothetical protein
MHETTLPAMLWIGDGRRPEFAAAYEAARQQIEVIAKATVADVSSDDEAAAIGVICLAQSVPAEVDEASLAALRQRFPGVPLVVLVGNWLEGEQRTGRPHPSAMRIPWTQAAAQLAAQLGLLKAGKCPAWGHGELFNDEERSTTATLPLAAEHRNFSAAEILSSGSIVVFAADAQLAAWLVDACRSWPVCEVHDAADAATERDLAYEVDAVLWAPSADPVAAQCERAEIARRYAGKPIVALSNFPRPQQVRRWFGREVREVLSVPVDLELLQAVLVRVLPARSMRTID